MTLPLGLLLLLTTGAAYTDARREEIPNRLSLTATVIGLIAIGLGWLPWTALAWAAATWLLYELDLWLAPQSVGWGDVKWAAITMGYLGGAGLLVLAAGHAGSVLWGTIRWWRSGRRRPWRTMGAPWAPGAWVGLMLLTSLKVWSTGVSIH